MHDDWCSCRHRNSHICQVSLANSIYIVKAFKHLSGQILYCNYGWGSPLSKRARSDCVGCTRPCLILFYLTICVQMSFIDRRALKYTIETWSLSSNNFNTISPPKQNIVLSPCECELRVTVAVQICWHMLAGKWGFPYAGTRPPMQICSRHGGMASTKSGNTTRTEREAVPQPTISVGAHKSIHKNLQKYSCIENGR